MLKPWTLLKTLKSQCTDSCLRVLQAHDEACAVPHPGCAVLVGANLRIPVHGLEFLLVPRPTNETLIPKFHDFGLAVSLRS